MTFKLKVTVLYVGRLSGNLRTRFKTRKVGNGVARAPFEVGRHEATTRKVARCKHVLSSYFVAPSKDAPGTQEAEAKSAASGPAGSPGKMKNMLFLAPEEHRQSWLPARNHIEATEDVCSGLIESATLSDNNVVRSPVAKLKRKTSCLKSRANLPERTMMGGLRAND